MANKLDKKDRQILHHLDINARISNTQLAKKIRLSKDAVGYRIKQLEQRGIIRGFHTIIDSTKLGYLFYRVYLNLMNSNPEKLIDLITFLNDQKNIWWIAKLDGLWDLAFAMWTRSNNDFNDFYFYQFSEKFLPYIKDKLICQLTSYKELNRAYLTNAEKRITTTTGEGINTKVDSIDLTILQILSTNSRIPLIEIAQKTKSNSMTIHRRIKRLQEKGIIQRFRVDINFDILQRDFYSVKIILSNISERKLIENHVKTIPECTAIIEAVGSYDFEFDLEVADSQQYFAIIGELESRFNTIREISYFRVLRNYKVLYMPEL